MELQDIDPLCDYWYRSPPGFIEAIGADSTLFEPEMVARERHRERIVNEPPDTEKKGMILTITHDGVAIGCHPISHLIYGGEGVFHAHIWKPEWRRIGIGTYTYPRACKYYFDRFKLKRILFRTPMKNEGPNRLKIRLGMKPIGEDVVISPVVPVGTKAFVYELLPDQVDVLLK